MENTSTIFIQYNDSGPWIPITIDQKDGFSGQIAKISEIITLPADRFDLSYLDEETRTVKINDGKFCNNSNDVAKEHDWKLFLETAPKYQSRLYVSNRNGTFPSLPPKHSLDTQLGNNDPLPEDLSSENNLILAENLFIKGFHCWLLKKPSIWLDRSAALQYFPAYIVLHQKHFTLGDSLKTQEWQLKIQQVLPAIKQTAEDGNAAAQLTMGYIHLFGFMNPPDPLEATHWFQTAADQGMSQAQFQLGLMEPDNTKSLEWLHKAAENGHFIAQSNLGHRFWQSPKSKSHKDKAMFWLVKAAQQGDPECEFQLGTLYESLPDYPSAVHWFKKAAEQGHAQAQHLLARCYHSGKGVTKDYNLAFFWIQQSAQQGNAMAQNGLGICFQDGIGVQRDLQLGFSWFQKSADQGCSSGQLNLGDCYFGGTGVENDFSQAFYWYEKAAHQGHSEAQLALGLCYYDGKGVARDKKQALYWFRKGAELGHVSCQYNLAYCTFRGDGIERNIKEGVLWYQKAAAQGDKPSQEWLKQMMGIDAPKFTMKKR